MIPAQLVTTYSFFAVDGDACNDQDPRGSFVLAARRRTAREGGIFGRQQDGRSNAFGLYTQRRQECHTARTWWSQEVSIISLQRQQESVKSFLQNGHQGEGRLAIVASGLKVKSLCRVDEMQNESGRK